jgi:hypothetical protein
MVNEPQEEQLLGDAPAVSDAGWDSLLSSTFSAPPGFADFLVDMFDSVGDDGEVSETTPDGVDDGDDGAIDPDAIDDDDLDPGPGEDPVDGADESDSDDSAADEPSANEQTYTEPDPVDALTGAGESSDDYSALDDDGYGESDFDAGDDGTDDIDVGDLGF